MKTLDCEQLLFDQANSEVIAFKVLVVGEPSVGKTTMIKRYVKGDYDERYRSTIGVAHTDQTVFWTKATPESKAVIIKLQFCDLAGQDRLNNTVRVYYRGAAGAICVCDVLRKETYEQADRWKDMVHENSTRQDGSQAHPPCVLVINKIDLIGKGPEKSWLSSELEQNALTKDTPPSLTDESIYGDNNSMSYSEEFYERIEETAQKSGFDSGFPTSVKQNIGIERAMRKLIELMLRRYRQEDQERKQKDRQDIVRLDSLMAGSRGNVEDPDNLLNHDPEDRITLSQARNQGRCGYC